MFAHVCRQLIILFFFIGFIILTLPMQLVSIRLQQKIYENLIIKDTMNIASHTFPIDKIAIRFSVFQFIK